VFLFACVFATFALALNLEPVLDLEIRYPAEFVQVVGDKNEFLIQGVGCD